MKQILKFVQEYKPNETKFSPYKPEKVNGKFPSLRWVEIQFFLEQFTYMQVILFQKNEWTEETEGKLFFREEVIKLFKDDFYAFSENDKRLTSAESHLVISLASGNFLGKAACSAVYSLFLSMLKQNKIEWKKYIPGEVAYRESLEQM